VDIGGTFTDVVAVGDDGQLLLGKVPSVPADPSGGVLAATARSGLRPADVERFAHGTTVATNALLERAGAHTALVTTHGFRDLVEIGRQNRPSLYDLTRDRPAPLVPRTLRFTLRERCGPDGVLVPMDGTELDRLADTLAGIDGLEAVAVCLLFSFAHPAHERRVAEVLGARLPGVAVVASSDVLPRFREYERFATAVADAYLTPRLSAYLTRLGERCEQAGFVTPMVMQSSGGLTELAAAAAHAARCVLSGPAAGVVGAAYVAGLSGVHDLLTFDMGGTSTDVAGVLGGRVLITSESVLAGVPVVLPAVDVHSVSAGGGSLAWVDSGGALRVGPRSAGADPGPACYGRGGTEPTVTDADLLLGYLGDGASLGGDVTLSVAAARAALGRLGAALGMTAEVAAAGVVAVADAEMTRALRVVSVERGLDPRDLTLVAFGGAGGMHACALADALGTRRVLVPLACGVLSALGLALGDSRRDYERPLFGPLDEVDLAGAFAGLAEVALADPALASTVLAEAASAEAVAGGARESQALVLECLADCRYTGQSHELTVPAGRWDPASGGHAHSGGHGSGRRDSDGDGGDRERGGCDELAGRVRAAFEEEHGRRYGHLAPDRRVEVVSVRLVATVPGLRPALAAQPRDPAARRSRRRAFVGGAWQTVQVVPRAGLGEGDVVDGPAVVEFDEATCLVRDGWSAVVDAVGTLVLTRS
jgi:N-methylhydantoinase A